MIQISKASDCCGCGACIQACPVGCISFVADKEGFLTPKVNEDECVQCGKCNRVCQMGNTQLEQIPDNVYAAQNINDEIRTHSSSGGIFYLIAEYVINHNGVVFGARFNEKWGVEHAYSETLQGIAEFMQAKYVQSDTSRVYKNVLHFLTQGRVVLFSGTPCQIAGLRRFLRKDYDLLICVDLACHGVPSPKVWHEYLNSVAKGGKIMSVSFRDKSTTWQGYSLRIATDRGIIKQHHELNPYLQLFQQGIIERQSCEQCPARGGRSNSDITLADFWGMDQILPQYNDNKGTSVLIVRSTKGREIVEALRKKMFLEEVSYTDVVKHNPALVYNRSFHHSRASFWRESSHNPAKAINTFSKPFMPSKQELLKRSLSQMIRWIKHRK